MIRRGLIVALACSVPGAVAAQNVAKVDNSGTVTGVGSGVAIVEARVGARRGQAAVQVTGGAAPPPPAAPPAAPPPAPPRPPPPPRPCPPSRPAAGGGAG